VEGAVVKTREESAYEALVRICAFKQSFLTLQSQSYQLVVCTGQLSVHL